MYSIKAVSQATGLTVESSLDTTAYPAGLTVSDADMATIRLHRDAFHGEWNYTIAPHDPPDGTAIP